MKPSSVDSRFPSFEYNLIMTKLQASMLLTTTDAEPEMCFSEATDTY